MLFPSEKYYARGRVSIPQKKRTDGTCKILFTEFSAEN